MAINCLVKLKGDKVYLFDKIFNDSENFCQQEMNNMHP